MVTIKFLQEQINRKVYGHEIISDHGIDGGYGDSDGVRRRRRSWLREAAATGDAFISVEQEGLLWASAG